MSAPLPESLPAAAGAIRGIDPRARVGYVLLVAAGIFFLPGLTAVAVACAVQSGLWIAVGLPARELARRAAKLALFSAFLIATYAVSTGDDPALDRWKHFEVFGVALPFSVNVAGALAGAAMALRILAVVLASQIARAGDPRAFADGLRGLGAPVTVAGSIDITLALLGGAERRGGGGGGGNGGGGGRGRHDAKAGALEAPGFLAAVRRLASTDQLAHRLTRRIEDAEAYAVRNLDPEAAPRWRDVSVISGSALAMLGIRALKVLPSIPFAPGHKLVVLTPLYVTASMCTTSRAGATLTGLTMGSISFLLGDGRYGIFEVPKHVAPGALCDLLVPAMTAGRREPSALEWAALGGIVAAGRFATILAILLAAGAPRLAWALVLPGVAVHVAFGVVSGWLTAPLARAMQQWRDERDA